MFCEYPTKRSPESWQFSSTKYNSNCPLAEPDERTERQQAGGNGGGGRGGGIQKDNRRRVSFKPSSGGGPANRITQAKRHTTEMAIMARLAEDEDMGGAGSSAMADGEMGDNVSVCTESVVTTMREKDAEVFGIQIAR